MSIYSRDYMRESGQRGRPGPAGWSVVTWLLVANVAVYFLQHFLFFDAGDPARNPLALSQEALASWQLWTPLTYQFSHANFLHLLGNMIGLFFLGRMLLQLTAPRHVLAIYFAGGLAGGFCQLLSNAFIGQHDAMVLGASGSVLAIVIAAATLVPGHSIHLLLFFILPIRMTMRQIALLLVVINALTLLFGSAEIAVMAHFGGMLLGWAYIRYYYSASVARQRSSRMSRGRKDPVKVRSFLGIRILKEGDDSSAVGGTEANSSQSTAPTTKERPFVNSDVDAILDKINAEGFQSLTAQERRILEKSSERLSRRLDEHPPER